MLWLFVIKHENICYVSHSAKIQVFAFYGPLVTNWSSESKVNVTKRERIKSLRNLFCKQKIVKKSRENMVVTTQKDKEETKPMLGLVDFASGGVHKVSLSLRFIIATVTGHWFPMGLHNRVIDFFEVAFTSASVFISVILFLSFSQKKKFKSTDNVPFFEWTSKVKLCFENYLYSIHDLFRPTFIVLRYIYSMLM